MICIFFLKKKVTSGIMQLYFKHNNFITTFIQVRGKAEMLCAYTHSKSTNTFLSLFHMHSYNYRERQRCFVLTQTAKAQTPPSSACEIVMRNA